MRRANMMLALISDTAGPIAIWVISGDAKHLSVP
jgi:hypothetical protein